MIDDEVEAGVRNLSVEHEGLFKGDPKGVQARLFPVLEELQIGAGINSDSKPPNEGFKAKLNPTTFLHNA